mgnify:CR=1 FL=1
MSNPPDADNQAILAAVRIGESVSYKAFNALAKNGHQLIAVIPKALAELAPEIKIGQFWTAQFTPYDLSTARLVAPLDQAPEDWKD